MDAAQFTPEAPGRLVEATDALGNRGMAFVPDLLPREIDLGSKHLRLALSNADRELAQLNGMARQIERPDLLFSSFIRSEAVLSSKIEGTHTTVSDLVKYEATRVARTIDDVHVSNYVHAFHLGRERVVDLPVGPRLFNELHAVLMAGYAADQAASGRFRDCQVFVGTPPFSAARYVPPPEYFVTELMENLSNYLDRDDEAALIKLAIAHYQFEAIHPYRDGNGRLGRMMISLWLHRAGILTSPMLYISAFFERNRAAYYDALLRVSTHGDWSSWILFFLRGVAVQSRDAARRTEVLVRLRATYHDRVSGPRIPHGVVRLVDALFDIPALSLKDARSILGVTAKPARASIMRLVDAGILSEGERVGTHVWYYANELINLVDKPVGSDTESAAPTPAVERGNL